MRFTVAPRGVPLFPPVPARPAPALAPLGKRWRGYTSPGVYEPVKAVTADGEWLFERAGDGTWSVGHLPTKTEVRTGFRSLPACQAYAASGNARAALEQLQAANPNQQEANHG